MAFKFFSAFLLGLYNSFNVFNLACLIVFLILIDFWIVYRNSRSQLFIYVLFFVLVVRNAASAMGLLDRFVGDDVVVSVIKVMNLALAGIFFVLGVLNFREWWQCKKTQGSFQFKVWPLFEVQLNKKIFSRTVYFLLAFLIGNLIVFLNLLWPQDFYLYDLAREYSVGRNWGLLVMIFLSYSLGLTAPILVFSELWLKSAVVRRVSSAPLIKISLSGFLFAVSLGLIFVIYRI